MKILIVTSSLPYPPASGGAIRVYGIVQGLAAAGHEVTLMAFAPHPQPRSMFGEGSQTSPLINFCRQIITLPMPKRTTSQRLRDLLLTRQPDIARRLYSHAFAERLCDLLRTEKFDLIQFEAIEVVCYLPIAKAAQPSAKICFDTFNAEYVLQRVIFEIDRQELKRLPMALYSWLQVGRIKRFEREMCRLADLVVVVSPEDAAVLREFRDDGKVSLVASGVVVDDYTRATEKCELGEHALVFTGKMDYRPNVDAMLWFVEAILPLIQAEIPDVKLVIVGQQPHPRLEKLREHAAITLTGWVDTVQPYLYGAAVYIAPLRMGSGTRLKILEAMACGCTIVATTTAAAGMLNESKCAMRIADDESTFAREVVNLLRNGDQRTVLGQTAQHSVRAQYDWSVLIPRLLAAYREIGLG